MWLLKCVAEAQGVSLELRDSECSLDARGLDGLSARVHIHVCIVVTGYFGRD